MTVAELPAYTGPDGVCPRCGRSNAGSFYHEGVPEFGWLGGETVLITHGGDTRGCMVRTCRSSRCGHAWVEACAEQS